MREQDRNQRFLPWLAKMAIGGNNRVPPGQTGVLLNGYRMAQITGAAFGAFGKFENFYTGSNANMGNLRTTGCDCLFK